MTVSSHLRTSAACVAIALCATTPAFAQQAESPTDEGAARSDGDIVVTAQKREERLRDVPATLLVRNAEDLDRVGVRGPTDLTTAFPGLTFTTANQQAQPAIRGVTTLASTGAVENPVAVYIDGVYQPGQAGANAFDLAFVSNVSVLKGPQGTVFGRNVVGGAILITTRDPSLTQIEGQAELSGSFFGGGTSKSAFANSQRLFVSVPLVKDRLAVSLAVARSANQGFLRDVSPGSATGRYGKRDDYNFQGKILIQPSDDVRIVFNANYTDRKDEMGGSTSQGVAMALVRTAVPGVTGSPYTDGVSTALPWQVAHEYPNEIHAKIEAYSLKADFNTPIGKLTSISSYTKVDTPTLTDADGAYSKQCAAAFTCPNLNFNFAIPSIWSSELNFASNKIGPVSLVGGAFIYGKKNHTTVFLNDTTFFVESRFSSQSYAFFGEATVEFNDRLSAIAGIRTSHDSERGQGRNSNPAFPFSPGESHKWSATTTRFSLRYRASDEINLYATYSEGYQAGMIATSSFNTRTGVLVAPLAPVRPQYMKAWEAGLKFSRPGLSFNLAGFLYNYRDIVVQRYSSGAVPILELANATRAKVYGVDADWNIKLTGGLQFTGGVSWLPHSDYEDFPTAAIFRRNAIGTATQTSVNLSGTRMVRAPKLTASLGLNYGFEGAGGKWDLSANYYHSSRFSTQLGFENFEPGYDTVGAQISFKPGGGNLSLALFGRNLTNTAYLTGTVASSSAYRDYYAPPREVGVSAKYRF